MCRKNIFKNYHTILYLWHTYVYLPRRRTERALFLLFFARFRSEVIEMEGTREGKGKGRIGRIYNTKKLI